MDWSEKVIATATSAWNTSTKYWLPKNILFGPLVSALLVMFGVVIGAISVSTSSKLSDVASVAYSSVWALAIFGVGSSMSVVVHNTVGRPLHTVLGAEGNSAALKNFIAFTGLAILLSVVAYELFDYSGIFEVLGFADLVPSDAYFLIDFLQAIVSSTVVVAIWEMKRRLWPTHDELPNVSSIRFTVVLAMQVILIAICVALLKINF